MNLPIESIKAACWGTLVTIALAILIVFGSRNLAHFDAALVAYTFATLFAVFGITYRYAMWLQRPPTAMYWRRGWQVFFRPKYVAGNLVNWVKRLTGEFALNRFIFKRGRPRWAARERRGRARRRGPRSRRASDRVANASDGPPCRRSWCGRFRPPTAGSSSLFPKRAGAPR